MTTTKNLEMGNIFPRIVTFSPQLLVTRMHAWHCDAAARVRVCVHGQLLPWRV